ncbi:MAG: patatin-like phospholipase family protein [Roseiflexaceae bacterium]|nr:patatin-like phospholipase family protein [Roseiflexaceae bacterium]
MNNLESETIEPKHGRGRTLALVMGGGGGKGGAHLGVLETIESIGIPIDLMVGTSIGGVVAVLYAAGYSVREIADTFAATSIWRLMERDPLGLGMLGLKRFRTTMDDMLGDMTFEELRIPVALVAADLVSGQEVVIQSGPIVEPLMGAIALPGIFPPLNRDNMVLADAGIVNNVPVDVARRLGADKVIAVDLGGACADFQITATGSGPLGLVNLLPSVPMTVANRGLAILVAQLTRFQLAANPPDVLICPEVNHIGMLEFVRVAEGQSAGAAAAQAVADQLLEIGKWRTAGSETLMLLRPPLAAQAVGAALQAA